MRKIERYILFFALYAYTSFSYSGDLSYNCVIKKVYDVNETGELVASSFESEFKGSKFSVSRETGRIIGNTLTTVLAKETRVINYGSNENSFKAIAEFESQFQLIEINEFKKDNKKPFIASSMGGAGIVTGICN